MNLTQDSYSILFFALAVLTVCRGGSGFQKGGDSCGEEDKLRKTVCGMDNVSCRKEYIKFHMQMLSGEESKYKLSRRAKQSASV